MKLQKFKVTVYEIAEVSTVKQLKTKYNELDSLDMRCRTSWEKALRIVQKFQIEFASWLENPPDEYKELFAEIERASGEYNVQLAQFKQNKQAVISIANELETLAAEIKDEGNRLKQEVKLAGQIACQADSN